MAYTKDEIKLAAYNNTKLPDMDKDDSFLWSGMFYCYWWFRNRPGEQIEECKELARCYEEFWEMRKGNQ